MSEPKCAIIQFTDEERGIPAAPVALVHTINGLKNYVAGQGMDMVRDWRDLYVLRRYKDVEDRRKMINQMETIISPSGLVISVYRNLKLYKPGDKPSLVLIARFQFLPMMTASELASDISDDIEKLS